MGKGEENGAGTGKGYGLGQGMGVSPVSYRHNFIVSG